MIKKSIKTFCLYLCEAISVLSLVYIFFDLVGFTRIFDWPYGGRNFVIGVICLFLLQASTGKHLYFSGWRIAWVPFSLWIGIFGAVQALSAGEHWALDIIQMNRYFLLSISTYILTAITIYYAEITPPKICKILLYFAWILSILLSLNSFIYLGYYIIFKTAFTSVDMISILLTNATETKEFLHANIGLWGIAIFTGLILYAYCLKLLLPNSIMNTEHSLILKSRSPLYVKRFIHFLLILTATLTVNRWLPDVFPLRDYRIAHTYMVKSEAIKTSHTKNLENFKLYGDPKQRLLQQLPGSIIVVIGESANRDHMSAFSPSYPSETTPWLSSQIKNDDFNLFPYAYSNYSLTAQSLSMVLTGINQYNNKPIEHSISLIDLANQIGYQTWYFSNQDETQNATLTVMANAATYAEQMRPSGGDDKNLLQAVKKSIPKEGNHFIVLHLEGSHSRYEERLPKNFDIIQNTNLDKRINIYDSTLLYTDHVLNEIFVYAKNNLNLQAMIYCSDHGEDMLYSHGGSQVTFDMLRIPFWVYLSPSYQEKYPETVRQLQNHKSSIFTNDLLYDAVSGILQTPNSEYNELYDITNAQYGISKENALTMHGQWKITDDPLLNSANKTTHYP